MSEGKYTDTDLKRIADLIGEQIISQFKTAFEALDAIKYQASKIPAIERKIDDLTDDMRAVKAALKDTNQDLKSHEQRIGELETTVYHHA